jgi:hypothetical protein
VRHMTGSSIYLYIIQGLCLWMCLIWLLVYVIQFSNLSNINLLAQVVVPCSKFCPLKVEGTN